MIGFRVSQNEGYPFGVPYNKLYSLWGFILWSPYFKKLLNRHKVSLVHPTPKMRTTLSCEHTTVQDSNFKAWFTNPSLVDRVLGLRVGVIPKFGPRLHPTQNRVLHSLGAE